MQTTTKVFKSGNSQAVRIPSGFQIDSKEVVIEKHGDVITIRPLKNRWVEYFQHLDPLQDFPDDIESVKDQEPDISFD